MKNVPQDTMPEAESKWNDMIENINSITLSGCDVDQFLDTIGLPNMNIFLEKVYIEL